MEDLGWLDYIGIPAIILAIVSGVIAYRSNTSATKLEKTLEIQVQQAVAKIEHESKAKDRMYEEISPLMFQLVGLAESALFKIADIVNQSGKLGKDKKSELVGPKRFGDEEHNFFKSSVLYRLFAPIACFKLIQEKLTTYDLDLDQKFYIQYTIAKHLFYSFSGDRDLAKILKDKDYERMRDDEYSKRQGLLPAEIDTLCEFFINRQSGESARLRRYDEFDDEYKKWKSHNYDLKTNKDIPNLALGILEKCFYNFDIKNKKILWRIIINQSRMYLFLVRHLEKELFNRIKKIHHNNKVDKTAERIELLKCLSSNDLGVLKDYLDIGTVMSPDKPEVSYDFDEYYLKPIDDVVKLLTTQFKKFNLRLNPSELKSGN